MRLLLITLIFYSQTIWARAYFSDFKTATSFVGANVSDSQKNTFLNTLFLSSEDNKSANGEVLSWPPLPRVVGSYYLGKTREATAKFGVSKIVSVERNIRYSYMVKTSFHYLASLKQVSSIPSNEDLVRSDKLQAEELNKILIPDHDLAVSFFNTSKATPIIGLCQLEITLESKTATEFGFTTPAGGASDSEGKFRGLSISIFSKFFNLKPRDTSFSDVSTDYSDMYYRDEVCGNEFLKVASPYAESQFRDMALQFATYFNPHSTCTPNKGSNENGDISCEKWYKTNVTGTIARKTSIARCEQTANGTSHCTLKARKGSSCPMYRTKDGNLKEGYSLNRNVTLSSIGKLCDRGLTCSIDSDGWFYDTASCK